MGFEITEDCEAACEAATTHTSSINFSSNSSGQRPDSGLHDRAPGQPEPFADVDTLMVFALLVHFGFAWASTVLRLSTLAECALTVARQALGERDLVVPEDPEPE
eukprot:9096374-Alexandrium_andersonii.AAC.1